MKICKTILLGTAALGLSLAAQAADWTVTTACDAQTSCTLASNAHSDMRLRGYGGPTGSSNGVWTAKQFEVYGTNHLGLTGSSSGDSGSPQHAIDNNGAKEAVLLDFFEGSTSHKMALQSLTLGWWSRDYDISVLYYDAPATTASTVMNGWGVKGNDSIYTTTGSMWGNWKVLGNYSATGNFEGNYTGGANQGSDCSGSACTKVVNLGNTSNITSSHWLVMAYSSAVGGSKVGNNQLSVGNDFFKLMSFTGKTVSEPGALAIAALGLFGLGLARRRRA